MTPEEIKKQKEELLADVQKQAEKATSEIIKSQLEALEAKLKEDIGKASTAEDVEELKKSLNADIAKLQAEVKKMSQINVKPNSNEPTDRQLALALKTSVEENESQLKGLQGGTISLDTSKAITTGSFGVGGYAALTNQDMGLYRNPYAPVYLRNIFPNISTGASNLTIWKQDTITGKAAIWKRGTGTEGATVDKPEVSPTWKKEVVSVDWIAGLTTVEREVLDDVQFVSTEIPYVLVYGATGILAAENKMIIDYIEDKAVDFTAVGDDFDNSLETIIAAAFGQLGDSYMTPSHILINNWDYLRYLAFNKSAGSGVYDAPNVDVKLINGTLFVNNLVAVPTPVIEQGVAYVIAADQSRYVSRQGLQMRASEEHNDNFSKNMVTFRAEVRGGFYTNNNNSFVKVELPTPELSTENG